ncbi:MAG: DUF445 family protein [Paenibacillaceae bacterium]
MNIYILLTVSVLVAAFIGGLTNHLAIKMLFHPRVAWNLLGRRVPFTPGLIPKRREEIAGSLGRVVSDYLVTTDGISELLRKEEFRESIRSKLSLSLHRLAEREETVEALCMRIWPEERWAAMKTNLIKLLNEVSVRGIDWLWVDKGWSEIRVGSLLPDWKDERREALARRGVQYIVEAIRHELSTANGDRMIRSMTQQLIDQAGGFLGALAGMFMDEGKITAKVRQALSEALDSEAIRGSLTDFIIRQMKRAEDMPLKEITNVLIDSGAKGWVSGLLKWEEWTEQLLSVRTDEWLNKHMEWIEAQLPIVVQTGMNMLENNMERIFRTIQLEKLVETQVKLFPIERLEEIILSVSGREFRAITWLGALLGGMIGLFQALLLRWIG